MTDFAIFLGASHFTSVVFSDSPAFERSIQGLKDYFFDTNGIGISKENTLDLFDSEFGPADQINEITNFLQRIAPSETELNTLYFVYVGHGYFRDNNSGYFWAIRQTEDSNQFASGLDVQTFGHSIRALASNLRCIGIIDSCFSGASITAFMGGGIGAALQIGHAETINALPTAIGSALLCSSSSDSVSVIAEDRSMTLFAKSLLETLYNPPAGAPAFLSIAQLCDLARRWQQTNTAGIAISPIIHSPQQDHGNLAFDPVFPFLVRSSEPEEEAQRSHGVAPLNLSGPDEVQILRKRQAATELLPKLTSCLDASGIHAKAYAYTSRVKSEGALHEKIIRKRTVEGNADYSVDSVTDIIGMRVITLFGEEMNGILDDFCQVIRGELDVRPNPFDKATVDEAIIYVSEALNASGHRYERLRNTLNDAFDIEPEIHQRQDYSSIHLVCRINVDDSMATGSHISVPVEIQIRSVFEDAWAQMDHRLRYGLSRQKNEGVRRNVSVGAENHLKILKKLLDAVGEYSDQIMGELEERRRSPGAVVATIDSLEDFRNLAAELGTDQEVVDDFCSLLTQQQTLDTNFENIRKLDLAQRDWVAQRDYEEKYAGLAEEMFELYRSESRAGGYLSSIETGGPAEKWYFYILRMEEAFCRLMSNDLAEINQAVSIYRDLLDFFPMYPVIHFRLGQALGCLDKNTEAIESYETALELLEKYNDGMDQPSKAVLTPRQKDHINRIIHRLLGFRYWRRGRSLLESTGVAEDSNIHEALVHIDKAWTISQFGLSIVADEDEKKKLINNSIAYSNDLVRIKHGTELEFDSKALDSNWLTSTTAEFEKHFNWNESENVNHLDSLAHVFVRLGKAALAVEVAAKVLDLLEGIRVAYGTTQERDSIDSMQSSCWRIVRSGGHDLSPLP